MPLLAATTLVVAACGSGGGDGGGDCTPPAANTAPAVSAITDQRQTRTRCSPIEFGVDDRESGAGSLTVTASADGTAVFPADGVVLSRKRRDAHADADAARGGDRTATIAIRVVDPTEP